MANHRILVAFAVLLPFGCGAAWAQQATFTDLGMLPGHTILWPAALSSDGTTVVGHVRPQSQGWDQRAFRWTAASGLEELGTLGTTRSLALAVDGTGSTVVGYVDNSSFKWTASAGMTSVPLRTATSISYDGNVIVGAATLNRIARIVANGPPHVLPLLPGSSEARNGVVSGDGNVVFGHSGQAFRWTEATGIEGIGNLSGQAARPQAANYDGSVVVGQAGTMYFERAFRWTSHTGMHDIGTLPGGSSAAALAVNADGSSVVGWSTYAGSGHRPFFWTEAHGMIDLVDHLTGLGVDLTGWNVVWATGISADGYTIVGRGWHQNQWRGWIAVIPSPSGAVVLFMACLPLVRRRRLR